MKLWYAPTSPFARKVRIAAQELGFALELVETNPWTDARLRALNPLAKVPTLIADDGAVLFESAAICEYLDFLAGGGRLFPAPGPARWRALLRQGLADGASTAAGRLFADQNRPGDQRSETMMARFRTGIDAALDTLDGEPLSADGFTIGEISVGALLGYLDFRWPAEDWRSARPRLADWYAAAATRPAMAETQYRLPAPAATV